MSRSGKEKEPVAIPPAPLARGRQVLLGTAGPVLAMLVGLVGGAEKTSPYERLPAVDLTAALLIPMAAVSFAVCIWQMTRPGARKLPTGMYWFLGLVLGTVVTAAIMLTAALLLWIT